MDQRAQGEVSTTLPAGEEPSETVVVSPQDGPGGRRGRVIWADTGSGPGMEIWVPDPPARPGRRRDG
jgi:hypothetical protein